MPTPAIIPRQPAAAGDGRVDPATDTPGARASSPAFRIAGEAARTPKFTVSRTWTTLSRAPASLLLGLIWLYQRTLSPVLPVVFGPNCGCRFSPTCSHYAAEAVRTHGALLGAFFALRRLVKCTPLHPGGFDPVPLSARARPVCRRATSQPALKPILKRG